MSIRHRLFARAEATLDRTPDWVFVLGPKLVGSLLLNVALLIGALALLSAVTGASMNPLTHLREVQGIMKSAQPAEPSR